jgi:hypothetical protein
MKRSIRGLLSLAILLLGAACAGRATRTDGRQDPDLIVMEELEQRTSYASLYDLIEVMRPRWLRSQGPDTFMGQPGQVQVHFDGNWLGSVNALRSLSPQGVTSIRWLSPLDAAARYGLDHSHGAIEVSTAPVH